MSWQATKAVRERTQFVEDRHFGAFRILLALADYADARGVVGVAGDHRKCVSYAGIAKAARVHVNTIGNWMPELVASGEVVIEAEGGNGRGQWRVYRLAHLDDFVVAIDEIMPQRAQEYGEAIGVVAIEEKTPQQIELLTQQIELLTQEIALLPQRIATIATTSTHTRVDPVDPDSDPSSDPISDPDSAGAGANGRLPNRDDALWMMATALVQQWQDETHNFKRLEPDNPEHRADYYAPALRLVDEFGGDGPAAWQALMAAYNGMLQRNLTPKRLEPVVAQALADKKRQTLPPLPTNVPTNGNGKVASNLAAIDEVFAHGW